ncbi:hypothetical protein STENM327S_02936 [Streptomyces tendae]
MARAVSASLRASPTAAALDRAADPDPEPRYGGGGRGCRLCGSGSPSRGPRPGRCRSRPPPRRASGLGLPGGTAAARTAPDRAGGPPVTATTMPPVRGGRGSGRPRAGRRCGRCRRAGRPPEPGPVLAAPADLPLGLPVGVRDGVRARAQPVRGGHRVVGRHRREPVRQRGESVRRRGRGLPAAQGPRAVQQTREAVAVALQHVGQRAVHGAAPLRTGGGVHGTADQRATEAKPVTGQDELPGQRFRAGTGSGAGRRRHSASWTRPASTSAPSAARPAAATVSSRSRACADRPLGAPPATSARAAASASGWGSGRCPRSSPGDSRRTRATRTARFPPATEALLPNRPAGDHRSPARAQWPGSPRRGRRERGGRRAVPAGEGPRGT